MGGLLVLFLIGLYVIGGNKLVRRTRSLWGKALIVVVAILIPTADAVYGRYKLREMCAAEGGLRIYRVVEGVAGFDDPKSRPDESWLRIRKYQFVEGEELSGKRSRLSVRPDGTFLREEGITPISEYVYEDERNDRKNIYHRYEQRIRAKASGEILGRNIDFNYAGGWFERFVNGLYATRGTAGTCGPFISATKFVPQILKPIKSESKS
jgi:hypothetical protein